MMQQRYRMGEDLDEYEDDFVERDDYEDAEEDGYEDEEEEEEEEEKPLSAEAIKYLELREKLKAKHRSNLRRENGKNGVSVNSSKLMNFGSFFGPSKPVIADRVIQERKSLLETRHLTPKVSTSQNDAKKVSTHSTTTSKNGLSNTPLPRQVKSKAQIIKQTRDYSFLLSDDADIPKPANNSGPQKSLAPKNGLKDSRSAEVRAQRNESCSYSGKKGNDGYEQLKPSSGTSQIHDSRRAPPQRSTSGNRASLPCDSRRQLDLRKQNQPNQKAGSSSGSGSRPAVQKVLAPRKPFSSSDRKLPNSSMERRPSAAPLVNKASVVAKTSTLDRQRQPMGKPHSSGVNNRMNNNRDVQRSTENRMLKKDSAEASRQMVKPQMRHGSLQSNGVKGHHINKQKPAGQLQNSSAGLNKDHRIKKRKAPESDDEEMDYRAVIRKMFRQPTKYYDDDDAGSDMEVTDFDTIMAEERKSARIAKQEDDEELIKIQEEERQEMLRKKARMRKMQQRR
ncbi:histone H3.v1-like [Chenopodium quinoa]|uniref:histone H3.v1-like n=1 Tax=Chenopodium quinoa TaxID=63459 RepID=UPI000B796A21|nr:histone H3.v1-like [Chenopodium quinoa]